MADFYEELCDPLGNHGLVELERKKARNRDGSISRLAAEMSGAKFVVFVDEIERRGQKATFKDVLLIFNQPSFLRWCVVASAVRQMPRGEVCTMLARI